MKRHIRPAVLLALLAAGGCQLAPAAPQPFMPVSAATGTLHLGIAGRLEGRRLQAFQEEVARYAVTLTHESGESRTFEIEGAPIEAGRVSCSLQHMPAGVYRLAIAAYDDEGNLLNASGGPDPFFPEGLTLAPHGMLGSQDAPITCTVLLRPAFATHPGGGLALSYRLDDGPVTPYPALVDAPDGGPRTVDHLYLTRPQLEAMTQAAFTAWTGGPSDARYVGPAVFTLRPEDGDPNRLIMRIGAGDDARTIRWRLNDGAGGYEPVNIDGNGQRLERPWTSHEVWWRRTATPAGVTARGFMAEVAGDVWRSFSIAVGPVGDGADTGVLGMVLVPEAGPPLHIERLSR